MTTSDILEYHTTYEAAELALEYISIASVRYQYLEILEVEEGSKITTESIEKVKVAMNNGLKLERMKRKEKEDMTREEIRQKNIAKLKPVVHDILNSSEPLTTDQFKIIDQYLQYTSDQEVIKFRLGRF